MTARIAMVGLDFRTAPIAVREVLAPPDQCPTLPVAPDVQHVVLATCNRIELYCFGDPPTRQRLFNTWLGRGAEDPAITSALQRRDGADAVAHLFRVAGGLESMVLGESQVFGQVKAAYQHGVESGTVGPEMHLLWQKAIEVGKRIRSETRIGENTVSIASTAVNLALQIFGPLGDSTALVIGAGEMATLTARHLRSRGIGKLIFTNRTLARAEALAAEFGGQARELGDLAGALTAADIVISSTGAPRPILDRSVLAAPLAARPYRPMFLIDIAVPRDIAGDCADMHNVFLYNIDDLQGVVDEHHDLRRREAQHATEMVAEEVARFEELSRSRTVTPLIRSLRERADRLRRDEVDRFLRRYQATLPPGTAEAVIDLSRRLMAKWLHAPTANLKELGPLSATDRHRLAELFGLTPDDINEPDLRLVADLRSRGERGPE